MPRRRSSWAWPGVLAASTIVCSPVAAWTAAPPAVPRYAQVAQNAPPDVAEPPEKKPDEAPPAPQNLEPLPPETSLGILGKKVHGPKGEDLGLIVDVVVDYGGRPLAAIIDFGGFLGVGTRKVAVDWSLLRFLADDKKGPIELNLSRKEIQAAPEYKTDAKPPKMVGPPVPHDPASSDERR